MAPTSDEPVSVHSTLTTQWGSFKKKESVDLWDSTPEILSLSYGFRRKSFKVP